MAITIKEIKDLGWDKIKLAKTTGFGGAVNSYEAEDGSKVSMVFSADDVYIVEDELGLYTKEDLISGILNDKDIKVNESGLIEGALALAWYDEDNETVAFNEDKLTELGINTFEVKNSITERVKLLVAIHQLSDMKF